MIFPSWGGKCNPQYKVCLQQKASKWHSKQALVERLQLDQPLVHAFKSAKNMWMMVVKK
jgi:hypothetical protein